MSKWDKLISRILTLDNDMRFAELRKALESDGYEMRRPMGDNSHSTVRKTGRNPITIPVYEPIKKVYVMMDKNEYSGQFKLRIPKSLHKSLAEHSKTEGISMNQYCLYLLAKNDAAAIQP